MWRLSAAAPPDEIGESPKPDRQGPGILAAAIQHDRKPL
jgi:hypothetical protein